MDNLSKILGGLLMVALIYIVFLTGCGSGSGESGDIITSDTVYVETVKVDTIKIPVEKIVLKYIEIKIPVPYLDTTSKPDKVEEFDDFFKERPMVYQDTISDDTVLIHYRIRTWGFIDKLEIGYGLKNQYYIKEKVIVETIVTKKKKNYGFYAGFDIGFNQAGFRHFEPSIELVTPKNTYDIGYDIIDNTFMGGVKFRIRFRKKEKPVPHP